MIFVSILTISRHRMSKMLKQFTYLKRLTLELKVIHIFHMTLLISGCMPISPAASEIPVGCEMIQICHRCQSLPKITCFKKNNGVTSQTLAVLRYSRWRSRWPTNPTSSFFSGTIDRTDVILVSSIGFSGSENPKNISNSFPNHHVTL